MEAFKVIEFCYLICMMLKKFVSFIGRIHIQQQFNVKVIIT